MTTRPVPPVIPAASPGRRPGKPGPGRPMPLASPPGRPYVVYGFGRIDASGRVADRVTIAALGWRGCVAAPLPVAVCGLDDRARQVMVMGERLVWHLVAVIGADLMLAGCGAASSDSPEMAAVHGPRTPARHPRQPSLPAKCSRPGART